MSVSITAAVVDGQLTWLERVLPRPSLQPRLSPAASHHCTASVYLIHSLDFEELELY